MVKKDFSCRSHWPRCPRLGSGISGFLGLRVRIPPLAWMTFSYECCVLSGRGICDRPITPPEESYRLWYIVVGDLETSRMMTLWTALGCRPQKESKYKNRKWYCPLRVHIVARTLYCLTEEPGAGGGAVGWVTVLTSPKGRGFDSLSCHCNLSLA